MHYSKKYFILPLFWGQVRLNYPLVADWGRHQRVKYPMNILGNQLHMTVSGIGV